MFNTIKELIRKAGVYLGIIKSVENISGIKNINVSEEMYDHINTWKNLYSGYHAPFHQMKYMTIDGEKTRTMDTLNMAKASASEMASLVYNSKCDISIGDDDNADSEFINGVLNDNRFNRNFQDSLEYSFAMGGLVVKPYVEDDKVKLSFVTADCFIPIAWNNESISEGVFVSEFHEGDKKFTHLEWHVWVEQEYTVKNEVYESMNGNDIGTLVPLEKHFPDLEEVIGMPKITKPLFVYFRPNTANNIDIQSPLGVPIYANALSTMKALDTAFDSFHREFRLGKKRIIVPAHMVKSVINEHGQPVRYFDSSDETYEAFDGEQDENKLHDISVTLRVDEHVSAINALLNLFAMQTGFSAGSFSFDGQSMKTATEVVSEQSKTFKTKQSHEVIIESGLQQLIRSIFMLAETYDLHTAPDPDELEVTIAFDDSIAEDRTAETERQIQLVTNRLQSKARAIKSIFGVTDDEAKVIVDEINAENATATAESVDLLGGSGG